MKWFRLMNTSASMIARPILAVLQYSPLGTGTSTSSVPRRPSPIKIWQPVVMGQKPFSWAQVRCSRAFFAAARIESVAVGQEGHTPLLLAQVGHHLGIVGPQEGQVAQFPKVHLDGHEAAIHIDILDARGNAQAAQFFGQTGAHLAPEIGKVYSGTFHGFSSLGAGRQNPPVVSLS